jgi:hypothetical protein
VRLARIGIKIRDVMRRFVAMGVLANKASDIWRSIGGQCRWLSEEFVELL